MTNSSLVCERSSEKVTRVSLSQDLRQEQITASCARLLLILASQLPLEFPVLEHASLLGLTPESAAIGSLCLRTDVLERVISPQSLHELTKGSATFGTGATLRLEP